MNSPAHPEGRAFVYGANHRTSGLSLRDRLFVEDGDVPDFLNRMAEAGVNNAIVLSTCDRVEIQGYHIEPESAEPVLRQIFARHSNVQPSELVKNFYLHQGVAAVRHLFSVAASLDSLVIGEPQVLGQIKAAHRMARAQDMVTGPFEGLMQSAYSAAKRVRTETAIGERPVSMASAACEIARDVHGDLSQVYVAMVGVGEMGELIARQFTDVGIHGLTVIHPIRNRAEPVAYRLGCHLTDEENVSSALANADVIICAMGHRQHALSADMVHAALKTRKNRPQLIIDAAVPGDVEPAVNRIDDAFLYELADLERVALEGQTSRQTEVDAADQIIETEVAVYMEQYEERNAAPAISQLREHAELIRKSVLNEHPDDATRATELLIAKLLHQPSLFLRGRASQGKLHINAAEQLLRDLFDLESSAAKDENNMEDDK